MVYCDSLDVRQLSLQTNTSKNARDVRKSSCHSSKPSSTHQESVVDTDDNVSKARPRAQSPETQISKSRSHTQAAEDTWSTSNTPGSISKLSGLNDCFSASSREIVDYQESNSPDWTVSQSALRSHNELNSDAELSSDAASDRSRSSDTVQRQHFNSESSEDDDEECVCQRALGHSPCWRGESAVEPRAKPPVTMSRQEYARHSCLFSASTLTGVSGYSPNPRPLTSRAGDPSAAARHSSSASSTTCKALSTSWEPFWEQCRLCHRSILAKAGDAGEAAGAGAGREEKPNPRRPARGIPSWFPMSRTASSQVSSLRMLVLGRRMRGRPLSATTTFRRLEEQDFAVDLPSPPRKPAGVKDSKGAERLSAKQRRWCEIERRNGHAEMASVGWCSGRPLAHQYQPRGGGPTRTSPRPGPGHTAAGASSDDSTQSPATSVADQQDKALVQTDPAEQGSDNNFSVNGGIGAGISTGTSEQQQAAESANTESLSLKDSQLISTARKWEWNFILSKMAANADPSGKAASPRITPSRSTKSDAHPEAAAERPRPRNLPAAVPGRKCCGSHSAFFSGQDSTTPSLLAQQSERAAERAGDSSTGVGLSIAPYTTDGSRGESVVQPPATPQKPTQRRYKCNTLRRCNTLGRYKYNTTGIHRAPNPSHGTKEPGLNDDDTGKNIRGSVLAESKPVLAEFPEQADTTRPPGKNVAATPTERGSETMMLLGKPFPVSARRCTTITYDFFPGKIHTTPAENKLVNAWVAKLTNRQSPRDRTIQEPAQFRCAKFEDPSYGSAFRAHEAREKLGRLLAGKKGRNNTAEPSGLFIVHGFRKDFCNKVDPAARKTLMKKSPQAPQPTVTGVPGQPKGSRQRPFSTTTIKNRSLSGKQTARKGVPGSVVGSLSNPETKNVSPPEKKTARKGIPGTVVGSPSNPETKNVSPPEKKTARKGIPGTVVGSPSNPETKNVSPPEKKTARKGIPGSVVGSPSNPETKNVSPPEKKTARKGIPGSVVGSPSNPETKNVSPPEKKTARKGVPGSVGRSLSNHETKNASPPGKQTMRKGVPASISGSFSNPETLAKKARWSQRTSQAAVQERPAKPEPKMNAAKGAGTPPRPNPNRAVRSASDLTKTDSNRTVGAWSGGARTWKVGVSRAVDNVGNGVTKPNASNRALSAAWRGVRDLQAIASHAGDGGGGAGKVAAMETDKNPPAAADAEEDSGGRKKYFNKFSNSALYNDFYDEQLVKIFGSMSVSTITSWNSSSTLENEESEEEEEEEENTEENKEDSKDVNDEEENKEDVKDANDDEEHVEDVKDANDEENNEEDSKVSNNDEENKDSKSANDEEDNKEDSEDANEEEDNEEDSEETDDEEPVKPLSAAMMKEYCRKMKQQSGGELETLTKAISSWNNSMYDRFSRVRRPSCKD